MQRASTDGGDSLEPRSLHVLASNARRGAEVFAVDLTHRLRQLGHETSTVAIAASPSRACVDVPVLGRTLGPRTLRRLRRAAVGADVIVAHGSRSLPAVTLSGPKSTPFIYRSIGDPRHWSAAGFRRARTGLFLRRADAIVVLWPLAADVLIDVHGIEPGRIHVIPNAASGKRFRPVDDAQRRVARQRLRLQDGPVVTWIGALSPEKDPVTALKAIAHLPDVAIVFAGDGPELERLRTTADDLGVSGRASFLGSMDDPRDVLAAADVMLLTSLTEGLPAVLIEAGLCGLPSVATDVGGVSEIVIDGDTGLLIPPGDHRTAAAALRTVLDHPGRFGGPAHRRCLDRFELDGIADRWAGLIRDLG